MNKEALKGPKLAERDETWLTRLSELNPGLSNQRMTCELDGTIAAQYEIYLHEALKTGHEDDIRVLFSYEERMRKAGRELLLKSIGEAAKRFPAWARLQEQQQEPF